MLKLKMLIGLFLFLCLSNLPITQAADLKPYTGSKAKLHIYLLIGQSNMAGRAPYDEEQAKPIEDVYLFNDKDVFETAQNPLNRYSTIRKGIGVQKMNPGYAFSQVMAKNEKGISIGLVVNARGGSSIKEWKKGTPYYADMIKRISDAQKQGELKGILWHQGETDEKDAAYLEKLKEFIADLRADLNMPNIPFVAGEVNNVPLINEQVEKLPAEVPNTACVSAEGLTTMDRWHFDTKSMLELGKRYAEKMIELQKEAVKKE